MAWKRVTLTLVLLVTLLASAAFAVPPSHTPAQADVLLSQIFSAVSTPLATGGPATESITCTPCVSSRCPTLCHKVATCELDPDTGCFFCSCFLNP